MITTIELKNHPEIKRVVLAALPNYKKHKAFVHVAETVSLSGTYWDSGSRSTYTAVRLADGYSLGAPQYAPPQFGGPRETPVVEIPSGVVIVETGIFCGKPATASVTISPVDATKFIGVRA